MLGIWHYFAVDYIALVRVVVSAEWNGSVGGAEI